MGDRVNRQRRGLFTPPLYRKGVAYEAHLCVDGSCVDACGCYGPLWGAQAKPITNGKAGVQCKKLAIKTLGPGFKPSNYNFIGGTTGDDDFSGRATVAGNDVFCGFGGDDAIGTLEAGDIFLGGAGDDALTENYSTVKGGADNDYVLNNYGTFNGGDGNDTVYFNYGTTDSVENPPGV
jgi:hypothetical protein